MHSRLLDGVIITILVKVRKDRQHWVIKYSAVYKPSTTFNLCECMFQIKVYNYIV